MTPHSAAPNCLIAITQFSHVPSTPSGKGTRLKEALDHVAEGTFQWSDFQDLVGDEHSSFTIQFTQHQTNIDSYEKEVESVRHRL